MKCERCQDLLKKIEGLVKKLAKFENAHTPPHHGRGLSKKANGKVTIQKTRPERRS